MENSPLLPPEPQKHAPTSEPTSDVPGRTPRRRRWRAVLAGGLAGGVVAASVAVPVTLYVERRESSSAAAQASGDTSGQDRSQGQEQLPTDGMPALPPERFGETQTQTSGTDATDEQSQGVVLIDTVLPDGAAAGTGMVISPDGVILTNYHVVEDSTSVTVTVATTGDTYSAEVMGYDEKADVAVLHVDATDLTTVTLDDDTTAVSDDVTAVGNALGQGYLSAVSGTIVAEDQDITASEGDGLYADSEDLTGLIETDAAVVSGYSGGPLLDDEGEVVGVTTAASSTGASTASMTGASESYAVPIDRAMVIVDKVEAGDETGSVAIGPKAYLGVGVAATTEGAQVAEVTPGGAAAHAGVEAGDTITRLGNATIGSPQVLITALGRHEPGDRVRLGWVDSAGGHHSAVVTLGANPAN